MEQSEKPKKPNLAGPYFFDDPAIDKTLKVVMALAREVYILQDRLAIIEKKLEETGTLTRADIDYYQPTPEEQEAMRKRRDLFLNKVLDPILKEES
jgi:hypothetical protein